MKKINFNIQVYIKLFIAAIFIIGIISCDEHFAEVNTNPNGIADVNPAYLFAQGARNSFRNGISGGYDYRVAAQLSHFYVGIQIDRTVDKYDQDLDGGSYEALFGDEYKQKLKYYNEIMMLTAPGMEKENQYQYAVADVMAVLSYSILTDAYGSIPYFEGGFGNSNVLSPTYDTQELIYEDMLNRLANDVETLKTAGGTVSLRNQDPVFFNNSDLWLRFANSLRFRLAMRMRHVEPTKAGAIITSCLSEPLMSLNAHNAVSVNVDGGNSQLFSPWYSTFDFWNFRISDRIVSQLDSTNDPRLAIYAKTNEAGIYRGFVNGWVDDIFGVEINKDYSFPGDYLVSKNTNTYLMTAAEIAFLQAECALFGLGGTDANSHYQRGIRLTMERVGVSDENITTFLGTPTATLSGTQEEQFEQIATQLWLSFPPNFTEAYATIRRTGYPVIPKRDGITTTLGATNGELPSRIIYPLTEKLTNENNVSKAIDGLGDDGDVLSTRVWWDVRR